MTPLADAAFADDDLLLIADRQPNGSTLLHLSTDGAETWCGVEVILYTGAPRTDVEFDCRGCRIMLATGTDRTGATR